MRPRRLPREEEATLVEHLEELRGRILMALAAVGVATAVAFAFHDDFGDRNPKLSTKLRERAPFRGELAAKKWREYFQDEFFVEGEDEVGSGGEDVRHGACEAMAAGDIIRNRQPLRRIGAKGADAS